MNHLSLLALLAIGSIASIDANAFTGIKISQNRMALGDVVVIGPEPSGTLGACTLDGPGASIVEISAANSSVANIRFKPTVRIGTYADQQFSVSCNGMTKTIDITAACQFIIPSVTNTSSTEGYPFGIKSEYHLRFVNWFDSNLNPIDASSTENFGDASPISSVISTSYAVIASFRPPVSELGRKGGIVTAIRVPDASGDESKDIWLFASPAGWSQNFKEYEPSKEFRDTTVSTMHFGSSLCKKHIDALKMEVYMAYRLPSAPTTNPYKIVGKIYPL